SWSRRSWAGLFAPARCTSAPRRESRRTSKAGTRYRTTPEVAAASSVCRRPHVSKRDDARAGRPEVAGLPTALPRPGRITVAHDIRIPEDIKPVAGRFGSGPSKVRPEGVESLAGVSRTLLGTSHRQKTVKDQVARLRRGIAEFFSLPDGYEVILSNGGTSAFWEVAAFGLVRVRAQLAAFGEFGAKFAQAVADAPFLADPTVVQAPGGSAAFLTAEAGVDTYASVHNENSTGVG